MLKIFRRLKLRELSMIGASLVFIVAQVWFELRVPQIMEEITQVVSTPGGELRDVLIPGAMMLLAILGSIVMAVIISFLGARVAASFARRLRRDVFSRVESFSLEEINNFSTASLITRTTNDVTQIQLGIIIAIMAVIRAPIMATWAVMRMSAMEWSWTALTGGVAVAIMIMIASLMIYAIPKFNKIQALTDNLNRVTRENLTGIRVVRAYNAEKFQEAKFEEANDDFTENSLSVNRAMQVLNPVMRLFMTGLSLGIFWIGAFLIEGAPADARIYIFSNMVVFSQYAMQVIMAFMMLTMVFVMMPRLIVSARRVNEVLTTTPKIIDGPITAPPDGVSGEVEFKNVSFKYPGSEEFVLRDISFKAACGETVAFIGSTGSGKSTLLGLIPRFYDVTEGQALVNGVDVREYKL